MIKKRYITPDVNVVKCKTVVLAGSATLDFTKEGEYANPDEEVL